MKRNKSKPKGEYGFPERNVGPENDSKAKLLRRHFSASNLKII